jgi:hypothetical protein
VAQTQAECALLLHQTEALCLMHAAVRGLSWRIATRRHQFYIGQPNDDVRNGGSRSTTHLSIGGS